MGKLITKEQARELIGNNNIETPKDIMATLKDMFKDVIQEVLEAEMDAIHYQVRTDGRVMKRTTYVVIGVNLVSIKDVLGIWISENETSKSTI